MVPYTNRGFVDTKTPISKFLRVHRLFANSQNSSMHVRFLELRHSRRSTALTCSPLFSFAAMVLECWRP
jgi:hypothetical protein